MDKGDSYKGCSTGILVGGSVGMLVEASTGTLVEMTARAKKRAMT
jgi:hypothetical protein